MYFQYPQFWATATIYKDVHLESTQKLFVYLDTKNVNASEVKGTSHRRQVLILTSGGFRTAETKAILNEALLLLMIDDDGGSEFVWWELAGFIVAKVLSAVLVKFEGH